jgi:UDP-N-acetylglucosamine transferase subunit ALG13
VKGGEVMIISEKFTKYYDKLTTEEKITTMKIVCELCDEHAELMDKKQVTLQNLLLQSNILVAKSLKAKTIDEFEKINASMAEIKKAIEKESSYLTIERYIEIHFGL